MQYYPGGSKNFFGNDKQYQATAREIFPILIQWAMTREPNTTYGRLASAVGRSPGFETLSLNGALGSVWKTLFEYQERTGIDIPYLTTIVVNQKTRLPTYFRDRLGWPLAEIQEKQEEVYRFGQWAEIEAAIRQELENRGCE